MEELVKKALQEAAALKKLPDAVPWKADAPWPQPCHVWSDKNEWESVKLPADQSTRKAASGGITSLAVYTWNIDAMLPFPEKRMEGGLAHLEELSKPLFSDSATAVVVFLQECVRSDLDTIAQNQWVRERFYVTDVDDAHWASGAYGTTTLVDRRLDLSSCFRVHYSMTNMERDGLFVDVDVSGKTIRLCNTHLESMVPVPPLRPPQMKLLAEHLHSDKVSAAVVAGDFNAVQPEDETLHTDNNLKDAYLELGGQEASADEGYTWGQQAHPALRERFGCSRMDKVFYRGEGGFKLQSLERFGDDVVVGASDKAESDGILALGFPKAWITDHLGLKAVFTVGSDHRL